MASALCQLSHVETSLGNARSAVALAEEAIDRLGDETDTLALAECRYALGLALVGTGQILGALEQLDQALVIFQDGGQALGEGTVHFRRAEILLAARRHAEAAVEAEQALAVFPGWAATGGGPTSSSYSVTSWTAGASRQGPFLLDGGARRGRARAGPGGSRTARSAGDAAARPRPSHTSW